MDLVCVKFDETMSQEQARCRHTSDYCRFRTSCMIHFLEQERELEMREQDGAGKGPGNTGEEHGDAQV